MSDYSVILLSGIVFWIVASCGDSRNSTVNTVIFGVSTVLMIFLRLLKVI